MDANSKFLSFRKVLLKKNENKMIFYRRGVLNHFINFQKYPELADKSL